MTVDEFAMLVGVVLSLAFSYVPGLKNWFETLQPDQKRLFMLGALFAVAAALFGLSCAGLFAYFPCTLMGAWGAFWLFVQAAIANQAAYWLSPKVHNNSKR